MRIALINTRAITSSAGKITYGQYSSLKKEGHVVRLFYGRYDDVETEDIKCIDSKFEILIHAFMARLTGLHTYFSNFATRKLIRELNKFKPDLVNIFCLHGYYINANKLLIYLGKKNIPVVYSMIDEFPYLGRCCYSFDCDGFKDECRACKINKSVFPSTWFFRFSRKFIKDKKVAYDSVSRICFVAPKWVLNRAEESSLLRGRKMYEVDEYVDTDTIFTPHKTYQYLDAKLTKTKKIIILTVAPFSNPRKGGQYFLDASHRLKGNDNYLFVYIGMDVENVERPDNCVFIGYVNDQNELSEYYSAADLFVCTSKADTMPNVCLDAMACGTPVLGFDITGIPYVAEEPIGQFVEPGNIDMLVERILKVKKKDERIIEQTRTYALSRYSPSIFTEKMSKIYSEMIENYSSNEV